MAVTYTPIATATVTTAVSSYTFTSIPSTYTDLVLILSGTASGSSSILIQVGNGSIDTAANYSRTGMYGNGSSAASYIGSNENQITVDWFTSTQGNATIHFLNYSNTTTFKTVIERAGHSGGTNSIVGLWRSTAAINQIVLSGLTFATGSTFTLYGIKAA